MNAHPTLMFWFWASALFFGTMLVIVAVRANMHRLKKVGQGVTGILNDENKKVYKAMALVALCILLLNILCSTIGWHWWLNIWAKQPAFWAIQVSLFLSVLARMQSDKLASKIFATVVTITVLCGIIWIGFGPDSPLVERAERALAPQPAPAPVMVDKVVITTVGQWSEVYNPSDVIDVTGGGQGRLVRVYGDSVPSTPLNRPAGKHIDLPHGTVRVRYMSEESPIQIILRVPKGS